MAQHADFRSLKGIASTIAWGRARHRSASWDQLESVEKLVDAISDSSRENQSGWSDTTPLDKDLKSELADVVKRVAKVNPQVAQHLKDALAHVNCKKCSTQACCNTDAVTTDVNIGRPGRCVEPIHSWLHEINEFVAEMYKDVVDASKQPTVSLRINNFPRSDNIGLGVNGAVHYDDDSSGFKTIVSCGFHVSLKSRKEGREVPSTTLLAIPALLFHELVAHSYYGVESTEKRGAVEPTDHFSEGWMDRVAMDAFDAWIRTQAPQVRDSLRGPGETFRWRRRHQHADGTVLAAIEVGRAASIIWETLLRDWCGVDSGVEHFRRSSLSWSTLGPSETVGFDLCNLMHRAESKPTLRNQVRAASLKLLKQGIVAFSTSFSFTEFFVS